MLIRRFRPGEEPALLALFQSSIHGLAARDYTPEQRAAWAPPEPDGAWRDAWTRRIAANRPWVVEIDGQPAAFADLQPSGHIDMFFVGAGFASRGVGAALMRHLHAEARQSGIVRLSAHVSLTAQALFRRFGFAVEAEQQAVVRGVALRNAVMAKALPGEDLGAAPYPPGRVRA